MVAQTSFCSNHPSIQVSLPCYCRTVDRVLSATPPTMYKLNALLLGYLSQILKMVRAHTPGTGPYRMRNVRNAMCAHTSSYGMRNYKHKDRVTYERKNPSKTIANRPNEKCAPNSATYYATMPSFQYPSAINLTGRTRSGRTPRCKETLRRMGLPGRLEWCSAQSVAS